MGLIVEKCPGCKRVTRCVVAKQNSIVGGLIFGIPFMLPMSFVHCVCGECGHAFKSRAGVEERAFPAEIAASLDSDALLALTNPELQRARILAELRTDPMLRDAFALLDRLSPGLLRFGLESNLARWPSLPETGRADLLGRVEKCAEAENFARAMAGRSPFEATGCILGASVTAAVWIAAWLSLDSPGPLGWALVGILGLMAGITPFQLLSASRGRRWVREVLIPEADRAGVSLEWVTAIIEKTVTPRGDTDDLGSLRDLAPAIRAEMDSGGGSPGDEGAGFGPAAVDHRMS